jgi:hypothetical protein
MTTETIDANEVFTPEAQERIREQGIIFTNANLDELIGLYQLFAQEPGPATDAVKFGVAFEMALATHLVLIMAFGLVTMPNISDEFLAMMIGERIARYIGPARELQGGYYEQHGIKPPVVN